MITSVEHHPGIGQQIENSLRPFAPLFDILAVGFGALTVVRALGILKVGPDPILTGAAAVSSYLLGRHLENAA